MRKTGLALGLLVLACLLNSRASAQAPRVDPRFQGGTTAGVPIFLDVDRDVVKPGASVSGWIGLDIGWIVFDLGLTLMGNSIHTDSIPEAQVMGEAIGNQPLVRWSFSPGIRLQVPTIRTAIPYLTGQFDANLWNFEPLAINCGWYYCEGEGRFRFAPGFTGAVGAAIRIKGPFHIDVGMRYAMTGKGQFFNRTQWWLEPFVGFLFRGGSDGLGGFGF